MIDKGNMRFISHLFTRDNRTQRGGSDKKRTFAGLTPLFGSDRVNSRRCNWMPAVWGVGGLERGTNINLDLIS